MEIANIKLTQGKAVAAIAVVAVVAVFRYVTLHRSLHEDGLKHLRGEIARIYVRQQLPVRQAAIESGDHEKIRETAERLGVIAPEDVTFESIDARGSKSDVDVKVRFRIRGAYPPDGKDVRYFHMKRSMLLGWTDVREVTAVSYYLRMF